MIEERDPADVEQRRIINETGLDDNVFVEAGAGSGKTKALIDRLLAHVDSGESLRSIAAITFTERAALELRSRLRAALAKGHDDSRVSDYRAEALLDLDGAMLGTIHSFALRILQVHAVEAGLPPGFEVLDEIAAGSDAADLDLAMRARLGEAVAAPSMALLEPAGVTQKHLVEIGMALADGLLHEPVPASVGAPGSPLAAVASILPLYDTVARMRIESSLHSTDGFDAKGKVDRLYLKASEVVERRDLLASAEDDDTAWQLIVLGSQIKAGGAGLAGNWGGKDGKAEMIEAITSAETVRIEAVRRIVVPALHDVAKMLDDVARQAAQARVTKGRVGFNDLLLLARQLLRRDAEVRAGLRRRYTRLLVDEFQDTDAAQMEIVLRVAGGADGDQADWRDVVPERGALVLIGDPKQSIYAFRGADLPMYLAARERLLGLDDAGTASAERAELSVSFRSSDPLVRWVNAVFDQLIEQRSGSQPDFSALTSHRRDVPYGAAVVRLGVQPMADMVADDRHETEARLVAEALRTLVPAGREVAEVADDVWWVREKDAPEENARRPARWGDVTILVRAIATLEPLFDALEVAGVPYRAESGGFAYRSPEIRGLMAALRAVDDPGNQLAVVTALRSPVFAVPDSELKKWREGDGGGRRRFTVQFAAESVDGAGRIGQALAVLAELRKRRHIASPSELLGDLVARQSLMEAGLGEARPRDAWRRLRFVVDQARLWADNVGGSLGEYLAWVSAQSGERARVAEALLDESDDDAVRVMTVHTAKGLQFPCVVVMGFDGKKGRRPSSPDAVHDDSGWQWSAPPKGSGFCSDGWDDAADLAGVRDDDELLRLLYVACTRAEDHLLVSTVREPDSKGKDGEEPVLDVAQRLAHAMDAAGGWVEWSDEAPVVAVAVPPPALAPLAAAVERLESELAALTSAGEASSRARIVNPSGVDAVAGGALPEVVLVGSAWGEGEEVLRIGGRDFGTAVHAVLEQVPFDTEAGDPVLQSLTAQACREAGIEGQEEVVVQTVLATLGSDVIREAAQSEHWRELPFTVPDDGVLVDGRIDLLCRGPEGLVVVDYKTDWVADEAEAREHAERYAGQMAAYRAAVEEVTGEIVVRTVLLFVATRVPVLMDCL